MRLWLDDERVPWKYGFIASEWAKNYDEAIAALQTGEVTFASLDHDIGACAECTASMQHVGDMLTPETTFYNRCPHAKSGYDVVCWMEENNVWPAEGVAVHSMNPVGRQRMQQVIDRHYMGGGSTVASALDCQSGNTGSNPVLRSRRF
jgi:hypothetical protein